MIHIYICDDEDIVRENIRRIIEKSILIEAYDMKIERSCGSPAELLDHLEKSAQRRNLYFLDVELNCKAYDGFQLGKKIRSLDPHGTIAYITSYKELAYKTFQYHVEAFDYIVKGDGQLHGSVVKCLASFTERMKSENTDTDQFYTLRTGDVIRHVPLREINFFETSSKPHFIILHGEHQRIEFLGSLQDIEAELADQFMRIHRSYLIAVDKIEAIDLKHNQVTVGGEVCLLSKKEKSRLLARVKQL